MPKSIKNIMPGGGAMKVPTIGAKRPSGPTVTRKPFKRPTGKASRLGQAKRSM